MRSCAAVGGARLCRRARARSLQGSSSAHHRRDARDAAAINNSRLVTYYNARARATGPSTIRAGVSPAARAHAHDGPPLPPDCRPRRSLAASDRRRGSRAPSWRRGRAPRPRGRAVQHTNQSLLEFAAPQPLASTTRCDASTTCPCARIWTTCRSGSPWTLRNRNGAAAAIAARGLALRGGGSRATPRGGTRCASCWPSSARARTRRPPTKSAWCRQSLCVTL